MAVNLSPIGNDAPFVDASGNPLSGGLLYTYVAGSAGSTPATTYTTSLGNVANANPIELNANGYPAVLGSVVEIWLTAGVSYLFILKTAAGVTVWSRDDIDGINDTSSSQDQWVAGPAPTFVSTTSFTLVGDQTSTFEIGRRLKTTNSGGTIYSTIVNSVFGAVTTVTVANSSGVLDSGLSAVSYGLLSATNKAIPPFDDVIYLSSVAGTNTITATAARTPAPLVAGQKFSFIPANANTGATTLNPNSLGATNVFSGGAACVGGELQANVPAVVHYDGTQFNIIGGGRAATWTPVVTFATPGNLAVTYTTQTGFYRRVGNMVTIWANINTATFTHTTASGVLQVTGVPFAHLTTAGGKSVGALQWEGITKANYTNVVAELPSAAQIVVFRAMGSAQIADSITFSDVPTGGNVELYFSITYPVAA